MGDFVSFKGLLISVGMHSFAYLLSLSAIGYRLSQEREKPQRYSRYCIGANLAFSILRSTLYQGGNCKDTAVIPLLQILQASVNQAIFPNHYITFGIRFVMADTGRQIR